MPNTRTAALTDASPWHTGTSQPSPHGITQVSHPPESNVPLLAFAFEPGFPTSPCGNPAPMPTQSTARACQVDGCDRVVIARGWCRLHYDRVRRASDPGPATPRTVIRDRVCTVDGCDRPHDSRGWCALHYQRWRKTGTTDLPPPKPAPAACAVEGCDRTVSARGWCFMHYHRWVRTGDPGPAELQRPRVAPSGCSVEGCDGSHEAKGFCAVHYGRWRRGTLGR
jgi:hypothetical protein